MARRIVARSLGLWRDRLLSRSTWNGAAVIAVLCIVNALRRNPDLSGYDSSLVWLAETAVLVGSGLVLSLLITVAVVAAYRWSRAEARFRYPAVVVAVLLASGLGTALVLALEFRIIPKRGSSIIAWMTTAPRYALLGLLFAFVYVYFRQAQTTASAAREAERDRARLDEQIEETHLQVLQAQIEPHFLFNTLATVRRLYQTEREAAESMLNNLLQYLTVALPQMRATDSTLSREAALVEAYLNIQRIRMGRRLGFAIDIDPSLQDARLPPMMLLTLTENALKHGLTPLPEGGFIRISARVDVDKLYVQVADSGKGFAKSAGSGTGLANIRARLSAAYGAEGRLALRRNEPRGVTATISLPYSRVRATVLASA